MSEWSFRPRRHGRWLWSSCCATAAPVRNRRLLLFAGSSAATGRDGISARRNRLHVLDGGIRDGQGTVGSTHAPARSTITRRTASPTAKTPRQRGRPPNVGESHEHRPLEGISRCQADKAVTDDPSAKAVLAATAVGQAADEARTLTATRQVDHTMSKQFAAWARSPDAARSAGDSGSPRCPAPRPSAARETAATSTNATGSEQRAVCLVESGRVRQ
jgi:hypothetical protein